LIILIRYYIINKSTFGGKMTKKRRIEIVKAMIKYTKRAIDETYAGYILDEQLKRLQDELKSLTK